ncbi:MAG: phosphatase PAP2 family protein [Cytophagales bacterium]|nr:phosphatase PAP2 family protein [Armatimonadota bacterium]
MGLGKFARRLVVSAARKMGMKARKYVAPVAPFVLTPLALGAGFSAGALVLFFNLADDIREQDGVWRFDHDGLKLGLSLRTPRRTALMKAASALARPDLMTLVGLGSLALSWHSPSHRSKGILLAVTLAGGGGIIGGIKHLFERERPSLIEALAKEGTFSFPSGHSFISLCFYGILTSWWMRTRPDPIRRGIVLLASSNAIALIGASRVYLGVHYPSDVLAGFAAAVPWLTACLTGYSQYEKRVALLPPGPGTKTLIAPHGSQKDNDA